jgi:C4-dicarboxylate-specific signal transduction histidine kinase
MRTASRNGITWRLSLITTFLVFLGFCTLGAAMYVSSKKQIGERLEQESRDSLQIATASLTQPVWVFDFTALDQITTALVNQQQKMVVGIRIQSPDQKTLIQKLNAQTEPQPFENLIQHPGNALFEQQLTHKNQSIGKVQIVFSTEGLDKKLYGMMIEMILLTVCMAFVGSTIVFAVTQKFLAAPLKGLVKIAQRIEQGDYSIQEEKWSHEFSILSRAFANAARAIQKRDHELKIHADNLEKQVEARTRELDAQRMQMVQSSRLASLGEVSAGIAHEINNPLAIIQGNAEILTKYIENQPKAVMHLEKITAMVQRISKIVKGLRTFARDGSKDPMHTFKVNPFLEELKDLCQARMKAYDIDFTIHCPPHLQSYGREVQISQVLINLLNNSIDAIEPLKDKWIRLEAFERNGQLIFAVTDSGSGIPSAIREKIMEPFFTTKTIGKGTGLGLAISIGIARDHGGDLVYVPTSNFTRFEIVLPQIQSRLEAA